MTPEERIKKERSIYKKYGWKEGDDAWYFDELGNIYKVDRWYNPIYAECLLKFGNCFSTQEEVVEAVKKIKELLKLLNKQ